MENHGIQEQKGDQHFVPFVELQNGMNRKQKMSREQNANTMSMSQRWGEEQMESLRNLLSEFEADVNSRKLTGDGALQFIADASELIDKIEQDHILETERELLENED